MELFFFPLRPFGTPFLIDCLQPTKCCFSFLGIQGEIVQKTIKLAFYCCDSV